MPTVIARPHVVEAEGNMPMLIQEYVGRFNSGDSKVSIARVLSPAGRVETGKTPEFDEYVVVLSGIVRIESRNRTADIMTGQAGIARKGKWVRYNTPEETEYMTICVPAFAPGMVNWDRV